MATDLDALKEQRWQLHQGGVPYTSWRLMPRWVREEQQARILLERQKTRALVGDGKLQNILAAIVQRILR